MAQKRFLFRFQRLLLIDLKAAFTNKTLRTGKMFPPGKNSSRTKSPA